MKRVLLSGVAFLAFSVLYGQQTELKEERLTAPFEKKWSPGIVSSPSKVLEVPEGMANDYKDQLASYAPVFLEISLKGQESRKAFPRPFEMHVFILRYKDK